MLRFLCCYDLYFTRHSELLRAPLELADRLLLQCVEQDIRILAPSFLTSTLSHLKALILFAISLKLHTTAFAFLKALLLFLLGFYHNSGFIRFGLNSAQIQLFYAALSCAPAWRQQRYKSLVARA